MATPDDRGGSDSAARAARAIERGATALSASVARSLYGRWHRMPAARRQRLERIAEDVKQRTLDGRREPGPAPVVEEPQAADGPIADAVEPARADSAVSDIEVRDLRDELTRELDRVARGEVRASRGSTGATRTDVGP